MKKPNQTLPSPNRGAGQNSVSVNLRTGAQLECNFRGAAICDWNRLSRTWIPPSHCRHRFCHLIWKTGSQSCTPHFVLSDNLRCRMARKSTAKIKPPRTLTDFIEEFAQYSSSSSYLKCFRGQRDSSWPNVAGIFRPDLKELLENEKRAVRDLISVHPHEFASDETMFDKLVRMQHFGLPTRLLDVSLNALVALYFATDPGPDRRIE